MIVNIVIIILMVILSAFFALCETAITSANKIRLRHKAEGGSLKAKNALKIIEDFDKSISTIVICNNIVNISASTIATLLALQMLPPHLVDYAALISTGVLSFSIITFGEILPKTVARYNAEGICMVFSGLMRMFIVIFTPINVFFLFMQNLTAKLLKVDKHEVTVTEEELMQFIEDIEDEGVLEEQESNLVRQALVFDETTVDEILTPRVNIVAVSINEDKEPVKDLFFSEGYSRLPLYDENIDNICGILNVKDFMRKYIETGSFELSQLKSEPLFVPSLMKLSDALKLMQNKKSHMAVVLDQYGGTQGLVTLEDILEELVGEIFDEGDEVINPVVFTADNVFEVPGQFGKNDLNRYFENKGMDFELKSDSKTVGGWVLELFDKIPQANESVTTDDFEITVLSVKSRMIERLRFVIK